VACQLKQIGQYFQRQLLQSRHRGAFELAYTGFVKMTDTLWRSGAAATRCLPRQWLTDLMSEVKVHDPDDRLCSTRRSAGVPYFVQVSITSFTIAIITKSQRNLAKSAICKYILQVAAHEAKQCASIR